MSVRSSWKCLAEINAVRCPEGSFDCGCASLREAQSSLRMTRLLSIWLADAFDDGGLEFAAVGAAEVELVTREADGDGFARAPFAGGLAVG